MLIEEVVDKVAKTRDITAWKERSVRRTFQYINVVCAGVEPTVCVTTTNRHETYQELHRMQSLASNDESIHPSSCIRSSSDAFGAIR